MKAPFLPFCAFALLSLQAACATTSSSPRVDGPEDVGAACGSCMTRFTGGFCVGCVTGNADVSVGVGVGVSADDAVDDVALVGVGPTTAQVF